MIHFDVVHGSEIPKFVENIALKNNKVDVDPFGALIKDTTFSGEEMFIYTRTASAWTYYSFQKFQMPFF